MLWEMISYNKTATSWSFTDCFGFGQAVNQKVQPAKSLDRLNLCDQYTACTQCICDCYWHTIIIAYIFQVILELLECVSACDFGRDELHLVHVCDKRDGGAAAHAGAAGQQHGPARHAQHTVHTRNVLQNLPEDYDVQVTVLTTWRWKEWKPLEGETNR